MTTVTTLRLTGLHDAERLRLAMNALQDLPHIGHIDCAPASGELVIEHGRLVSEADIRQALAEAGFEVAD